MSEIRPGDLRFENVTFRVGGRALVEDVSLEVSSGEMVGLIGPNGAGKSTLLRTVYRVNRPDAGRVSVNGEDAWRQSTAWVARNVGVVLQDMPSDFPLTVRDIVAMGRTAHNTARDRALIDAAIALQDLDALQGRFYRTLSGGERQRVLIARALVQQPRLLVLDEPTNHLDIHNQLDTLRFVRRLGITVVAALHDLNLAAMFCDRLCALSMGKVVAVGTPDEVLTEKFLAEVYRVDAVIQRHPKTGTPWVMAS
jgi:iron complex transport system ATP-binding protein